MPKAYCHSCQKTTHHKVVMERNHSESPSVVQSILAMITQGGHYVEMEKQCYCRVCNTQNEPTEMSIQNARVV